MKNYLIIGSLVLVVAIVGIFGFKMMGNKPAPTASPSTSSSPAAEAKSITLAEIATHKDATSCWMAIEGNVFDVTSFIPDHPGEDAILLGCGKDATEMFNTRPNDGSTHSNKARQMLQRFQ